MGKSELQSATFDWQKRASKYAAAGIPATVWEPIATHDLTDTYVNGSSGMTNAEADTAVYSAFTGQSAVNETPRHRSGFLGGLETILSNIVPDIGNDITSLPRGLFDLGKDLVSPSQWEATGKDLGTALSDLAQGKVGESFRDAATSPILSLIPGLTDAADMTTAVGRTSLEEHPVTGLLDILPIAKPLSAGVGAAVAGEGALGDAVSAAGLLKTLRGKVGYDFANDPTAQSALVAGKPILAGLRGLDRALGTDVEPFSGQELGRGQKTARAVLDKLKLDAKNRAFSSLVNRAGITAEDTAKRITKTQIDRIYAPLDKGDPEAFSQALEDYSRKVQMGDYKSLTPEETAVFDMEEAMRAKLEDEYTAKKELYDAEVGKYPWNSTVAKYHRARNVRAARVERTAEKLIPAKVRHIKAQDSLDRMKVVAEHAPKERTKDYIRAQKNLAKANKTVTDIQKQISVYKRLSQNGTNVYHLRSIILEQNKLATAQAALRRAQSVMDNAHANAKPVSLIRGQMQAVQQEARTAENELAKATADHQLNKAKLMATDERLQKAIIKDPPAHLHPWIKAYMRDRISRAYLEGKGVTGIDTAKIRELSIMSEHSQMLKDIGTAPMDRFYELIGKDETKALFADAVQEALKLAGEGLAPMYTHSIRLDDMENLMSMHVTRELDVPEAQLRKRIFNMESTVFNNKASLTREMLNTIERDAMQVIYDKGLIPHQMTHAQLREIYLRMHQTMAKGRKYSDIDHQVQTMIDKEWTKFNFEQFGLQRPGTVAKGTDVYIPKSLADNLQVFTKVGGGISNLLSQSKGYNRIMGVFRTSVLYGPRHFAHVVIGGLMPILLEDPKAFVQAKNLMGYFNSIRKGESPDNMIGEHELPAVIGGHFDAKTDSAFKHLQTQTGKTYGRLLKDFWEKTGKRFSDGLAQIEDASQSMYQAMVYLDDVKRGVDPLAALEHARRLVVNLDGMAPFERTIFKQMFPFYSFTRFATKFLVQLPFDHPLRVGILSQLSLQAQEEWGTGLPQTMMSLFFIGHPDAAGNIDTVNLRNMNPFRSVSSMFTVAGFLESLNPILQAPFIMAGYNPLSGSTQMYPEVVYDAQTGGLTAARPKGDLMSAAEAFVPELGGLDYFFNTSDNLRALKQSDPGAFDREILSMFNIPFAFSQYNLPETRGKVAENAFKGAQNALTAYKKGGDYQDTIGRYNLIPYQGQLLTPEQFRTFWDQQKAVYAVTNPGADPAALIPKPPSTTTNTLQQLINYYSGASS